MDPLISGIRWVDELIEIAGGRGLFPELRSERDAKRRAVDPSVVANADPEVVIASWCGKQVNKDAIRGREGWAGVSAVRSGHIFEIKSSFILQPGPAADLDQLKNQAKELLAAIRTGDSDAIAELRDHHPDTGLDPGTVKLADTQVALARMYQASGWTRLVQAVKLSDAIWSDDLRAVLDLVTQNRHLLFEETLIRTDSNWGPPMTYAANLGRDRIIRALHEAGATDHRSAWGRAVLQGKIETAKLLRTMLGNPVMPDDGLGGPAYTLSVEGSLYALGVGARVYDDNGKLLAPVDVVLETDSRKPAAKHKILELYEQQGVVYPDTPTMALHRGRIDLLAQHLSRDPLLLGRTFSHREIYPGEMGCLDPINATVGTPLGGTTLLHMCVDYDEMEIALWLLGHGMEVNARSNVGASGFGGYTALFSTVVSQPNFWMNYSNRGPFIAPFTSMLLDRGADPNIRASIWKQLHPGHAKHADDTRRFWIGQYK